jgi:cytochrome c peroxidase
MRVFCTVAILATLVSVGWLQAADEYRWELPKGFPPPRVPADNPMTPEKVRLGRHLFYDKRMSANESESCATCHRQELAFTDGRARAIGVTGELHPRGAMSLVNIAYAAALTWIDPSTRSLEDQMLTPMFGRHPVELGLPVGDAAFLESLRSNAAYRSMFVASFPQDADPFTIRNVTRAIACFERTIISARSPYDRYHYGRDDGAISESAKRGETLFFSEPLSCFRCHGGFNFTDATNFNSRGAGERQLEPRFHNTGVSDPGKFKTPTLRNIALTAPYMHDGSFATLDAVVDHYASGGHKNPELDPLVRGFTLPAQDRADLIAFLRSLTDEEVTHDERFSNPWK